jgi:hypothetical protein
MEMLAVGAATVEVMAAVVVAVEVLGTEMVAAIGVVADQQPVE